MVNTYQQALALSHHLLSPGTPLWLLAGNAVVNQHLAIVVSSVVEQPTTHGPHQLQGRTINYVDIFFYLHI